ncbi:MAG: glycosyltransferase [Sphingobacteriales bacterium]|nr:MAG: glycosyltransferase [Sphingobacteriales bacterium]
MKNNLSLLVGLKNNLDYSKNFYTTTRALYPDVEIVFTSYGSTDGTHEWLDSIKDDNVKYYYSADSKTLSDTYNKCTELATKEYVIYAHNDMVLAPGFIENLEKLVSDDNVVTYLGIVIDFNAGIYQAVGAEFAILTYITLGVDLCAVPDLYILCYVCECSNIYVFSDLS